VRLQSPLGEREHDMSHGVRDRGTLQLAMRRGHRARVSAEPGSEERALGRVFGELERPLVGGARVVGATERAK